MRYIKKYSSFTESTLTAPSKPVVKPGIDTPTRQKPSRPRVIPTEKPGTEDAPLAKLKHDGEEASVKDVYNRLTELASLEEIKEMIK